MPQPVSTATGDPRRFKLEVRPHSATRIDVFVLGVFKVPGYSPLLPATPMPVRHGVGLLLSSNLLPDASRNDPPDPALDEANESYALQLNVQDGNGHTIARGVPQKTGYRYGGPRPTLTFQTLSFDLDRRLPPDSSPYTVTARWRATPDGSASSRMLISSVPNGADTQPGGRFIGPPYGPADVLQLIGETGDHRRRHFVSEVEPHTLRLVNENDDARGLGPIVSDPVVDDLRAKYIGVPVYAKRYEFNCVDANGRGAVAELKTGKSLSIDTIFRVGHVMTWLPDDPRQRIYSFPCNGDCSKNKGAFTDSPLVVGFKLDAGVTTILPQPHFHVSPFDGRCERGYTVLQNQQQFIDIFSLAKQ